MFYTYWSVSFDCILIFLLSFFHPCSPFKCIHPYVQPTHVHMSHPHVSLRTKRHLYVPLHIHMNVDVDFDEVVRSNVEKALSKVVGFFLKTFEVRQMSSPFLLERLNCAKKWQSGVNKNKCSRLRSGPEFCSSKLTDYIIPEKFLNKLEVFNYSHSFPNQVLEAGKGILDANFLLFVISKPTSWCAQSDVQAYGSYCRLNSKNRPVAGLLNLCPSKFMTKVYRDSYYFNVIMHEVIHILGFSQHLFPKFKTCVLSHGCEIPKKITHSDKHGIQRLVFPEVVKSMQAHFNCSDSGFGAPLEPHEATGSSALDEAKYTSHWHPTLMYTSIMTPSLLEDSYAVIDNITLALLYSTGWYKVNFTNAHKFQFGKGAGCSFGFNNECNNSIGYNSSSYNASRCDVLEYSIGICENMVPLYPCTAHYINKGDSSFIKTETSTLSLYMIDYQDCASVQDENNLTDSVCMLSKCRNFEVEKISENSLNCFNTKPKENFLLCNSTFTNPSTEKYSCKYNNSLVMSMQMHLTNSTAVATFVDFKPTYSNNISVNEEKAFHLYNAFCLSTTESVQDIDEVMKKAQILLKCSYMQVYAENSKKNNVVLKFQNTVPFAAHNRLNVFIILAVCGILVMACLIISILKLYFRRQNSESIDLKDVKRTVT